MSSLAKIYEKCLTTFKAWSHKASTSQQLAIANFNFSFNDIYNDEIECSTCDLVLHKVWDFKNESIAKHLRESSWCLSTLKAQKQVLTSTTSMISKEVVEQIVKAQAKTIETSKFEVCVNDIKFFDSIMQLNLLEFHLFNISVNFLQDLDVAKYKEQSILTILVKCLRDSTYKWLKTQLDFTSLNVFKQALATIFSSSQTISIEFSKSTLHSSSQYHTCSQCFAKFSFISRLLQHTQKNNCFKATCKHCEKIFSSNNKLHEHVRLKHARRFVNFATSFANSFVSRTFLKASQSSISTFKTLHAFSLQISFTSFITFSHKSSLSHHKSHIKLYMTIDDLYVMFAKKKQKSSLDNIQINTFSSLIRQTHIIDYFNFICNIALNTSIKFKASKYELSIVSILSINQRSRSSQAQNSKQSSNVSNSISLQSITLFSILRINQSIKDLKSSLTFSRIELIRVLIRATITQLTSLLNSLKQDIWISLTFFILT